MAQGGLALILGWRTRWVAGALIGVMLGAFRVHWGNGWYFAHPDGGWEYLAVLVVGLATVALLGPGAASVGGRALWFRMPARATPRQAGSQES